MKKTLLASAVLFALSGPSMGADNDFIHQDTVENYHGALNLAAPPSDFNNTPSYYDHIKIETAGQGLRGNVGEKNNSYLLKVNKSLTVSSAYNSGIFLCTHSAGNHAFVIEAPEILIENVGDNSGIHMDSINSSITVQKFEKFTIDATGHTKNGNYEGNGLRVNQNGSSIELDGKSIKITAGESGAVVTSNGSITLSADSIEITSWGHGANGQPYKGQGVTVKEGGKISLKAKDKITISNENYEDLEKANALHVMNGTVEIDSLEPSAQKPIVTVNGKIKVNDEQAILALKSDNATVNGDIDAAKGVFQLDGKLVFNGNKAEIDNLTGNEATFTMTDASQEISIHNANHGLTLAATGDLNDQAGIDVLKKIILTGKKDGVQLVAYEGMYSKGTTAVLDGKGNLTNVIATTNSIMSNTLDLASTAPLAMNRLLMNDVRKHMGDLRAAEGTHGVWARYDGGNLSGERGLENDFTTVQVGIDTVLVADAPRFGVAFAYTKSEADMMRGSADMDAFSLAFYGTKFYDNGMFVDVIGRMATADTDITVDGYKTGTMDNVALSLSGEMGWRFDVTEKFYFEPQAELTYTYVNADKLTLSSGHKYEFNSVDSLMARVGFAAGFKCPSNYGDVYVRASAVHEFLGNTAVMGGKHIHEVDGKGTWVEFGIGAQFNVNKNTYVYADIERAEGATLEEDWRANVGVRYAF